MSGATLHARDLLHAPRLTVSPDAPALDALRAMLSAGATAAPVVDAAGKLVGLLSELDGIRVCNRAWIEALPSPDVQDVMVRDLVVAHLHTPALTLAAWFEQHRFHQVPVVQADGALVGVVTRSAVLAAVLADLEPAVAERRRGLYLSATVAQAPARLREAGER